MGFRLRVVGLWGCGVWVGDTDYRSTLLIRNGFFLGLYSRPMPRALWWC